MSDDSQPSAEEVEGRLLEARATLEKLKYAAGRAEPVRQQEYLGQIEELQRRITALEATLDALTRDTPDAPLNMGIHHAIDDVEAAVRQADDILK
jgi:hypothetical protein